MENRSFVSRTRRWVLGGTLIGGLLLAGCTSTVTGTAEPATGGESAGAPAAWYTALDEQFTKAKQEGPVGEVPVLSLDADCALVDAVAVAGEETEKLFGTGVRTVGESGEGYVCAFSGPSVKLSITRFEDAAEYADVDAARRAEDETGNVQTDEEIVVGGRTFVVVRTSYPTNDSHIDYGVTYLDDAQQGLVRLDVETTDTRGLIDSYSEQQAAQDLAALLDG